MDQPYLLTTGQRASHRVDLSQELRALFRRDGYLVLKSIFSADEIQSFRDSAAILAGGKPSIPQTRHLYEIPGLEEWWSDPRLLDVGRQLLGGPLIYFFTAHVARYDFVPEEPVFGRHLHHDAKGTPEHIFNRLNGPQTEVYPVIRMAVYLQDTTGQSGGLKLVPGSHLIDVSDFDAKKFTYKNVATQPGDLVVFSHRILHSPFGLRPIDEPDKAYDPITEDHLYAAHPDAFLPIPAVRETMFVDFAAIHELSDLFIKNRALMSRERNNGLAHYLLDRGILDAERDDSIVLRSDRAIVETAEGVFANLQDGNLTPEAIRLLQQLPKLCRAHWECSDFHELLDMEIGDDSLETARLLFNRLAPRIGAFRQTMATKKPDPHMEALTMETLKTLAREYQQSTNLAEHSDALPRLRKTPDTAYNPRLWKDFNRQRLLSFPIKKLLTPNSKIFTMGSCFAMQIRRAMAARGLKVYPDYAAVRYDRASEVFDKIPERESLQHYDTFSIRQEFESALGGWPDRAEGYWAVREAPVNQMLKSAEVFQDPYRKLVYATTRSALESLCSRITASIAEGIAQADIIVLTLGLTEVWRHNATGRHLCRPPGTGYGGGVGLATFRQSTFLENYQNVRATLDLLFARFPNKQVVISVSPVALEATYSMFDVGTANTESKAIMRAVAGQICREYENVMYFPSYEMAMILGHPVFEEDGRHIHQEFADRIVEAFVSSVS